MVSRGKILVSLVQLKMPNGSSLLQKFYLTRTRVARTISIKEGIADGLEIFSLRDQTFETLKAH